MTLLSKTVVTKSKEVETQSNLAESSKEGYGSRRVFFSKDYYYGLLFVLHRFVVLTCVV
jgi:hypothetical protein